MTQRTVALRRALAAAGAASLVGIAERCSAAGPDRLPDTVLPSAYLDTASCNDLTAISVILFQGLSTDAAKKGRRLLSRQPVRAIATRHDEVNAQMCAAVTPVFAGHDT